MPIFSKWIVRDTPDDRRPHLEGLPSCLADILCQRGLHQEPDIKNFLTPRLKDLADPFLLPEMDKAVTRLFEAIDKKESVVIYGDYDVDGTSSITIMSKILAAYGLDSRPFVPIRSTEGYGLNEAALKRCMEEGTKPDLLISVDCGTISVDPIAKLRQEGIDVIVIDHHEAGEAPRPDCNALVNPKFGDDFGYLCAAGVVFKVAHALLRTRPLSHFDLKSILDLVALATICDIVPLLDENRILVKHGLRQLDKTVHPGLERLIKTSAAKSPLSPQQAAETVQILDTTCEKEAESLADRLEHYNRQRQELEQTALAEALAQLKDFDPLRDRAIVVGSDTWHPGVVGIVASRLMQRYHCPSFVISFDSNGQGKGSGRSIEGISLVEAIEANRDLLIEGGGHHMAAGLSIEMDKLDAFKTGFSNYVRENINSDGLKPSLILDAEVSLQELDLSFLDQYEKLQPFGAANRQPVFLSRKLGEAQPTRLLQGKHNKFKFCSTNSPNEIDGIYFASSDHDIPSPPWDVAYTIERNNFRGRTSLQMIIKDIRAAQD